MRSLLLLQIKIPSGLHLDSTAQIHLQTDGALAPSAYPGAWRSKDSKDLSVSSS